jgi:UDP-glucose 4-epimerase
MMQTLIIGKNSNLSQHLQKSIQSCVLVSSREMLSNVDILEQFKNKTLNLIFNNFQPATQLKNLENPDNYIQNTIYSTAIILDFFKNSKINKIIYTSSSSVYGENSLCSENSNLSPFNLHSSIKIANEMLIKEFCENNNIDYTIARIFNMYGGNDTFSIISKIIHSINNNSVLTIVNKGKAIRDFIHIDNVVEVYAILLEKKNIPLINIGSGVGNSVAEIIKNFPNIKTNNIDAIELKKSIADNKLLTSIIKDIKFFDINKYLKEQLNI